MPLVFTGLMPHPPCILPGVGKDHRTVLQRTRRAMEHLAMDLHAAQPDLIVMVTPHGSGIRSAFVLNVADQLVGQAKQFGDLVTNLKIPGAPAFALRLRERAESQNFPCLLQTEGQLDYGITIPMSFIHRPDNPISLLPVRFADLPESVNFDFGRLLAEEIHEQRSRVAVIASTDLSHCLSPAAPGGFQPEGKQFDTTLVKLIKKKDFKAVRQIDPRLVEMSLTCGFRALTLLLGVLGQRPVKPDILSYEGPLGVGYACINFILP